MRSRRLLFALAVVATIAIGAASRIFPMGFSLWDKSVGDVAYAVMVAFLIAFVRPRASPNTVAAVATGICFALEVFQLTGIPARQPRVLRIILGTHFAWHDMACYAIGGVIAVALLRGVNRVSASGIIKRWR